MESQEAAKEEVQAKQKSQNDEAMKLFRERWWDRLNKTWLYELIHGRFMGRAGEITIVLRKDNKIALRPWRSKRADKNQSGAFDDIYRYVYFMGDNMSIIDQHNRNMVMLNNMMKEYREKHGTDPVLDDLFKFVKPTLQ